MYIEDILDDIKVKDPYMGQLNPQDRTFLLSIIDQMSRGTMLTTRQGHVIVKILRNNLGYCEDITGNHKIGTLLIKPEWRTPLKPSIQKRSEVRYIGLNLLAFSFTATNNMMLEMSKLKPRRRNGFSIVEVTADILEEIVRIITIYNFEIDQTTEDYLDLCARSKKSISNFIKVDDGCVIQVCDNRTLSVFCNQILGAQAI